LTPHRTRREDVRWPFTPYPARPLPHTATHPALRDARAHVHATDEQTLADQLELVRIPAPPLEEQARGRRVAERFREIGLDDVRTDDVGNVLGTWTGRDPGAAPVVVAAHLDTVFPADADLEPRRAGNRIHAPGITDNCRGLAGLLAVARALASTGLRPPRTIVLAATVGEEANGDLRGVKHLFADGAPLRDSAAFVAFDGSGMRRIVTQAIGARRLRVEVRGPGGHTWSDRGAPNPLTALAAAIAQLGAEPLPGPAAASRTVARMSAGTSINAIPDEAWMEVDLRSEANDGLPALDRQVRDAVQRALTQENASRRQGTPALTVQVHVIGDRPAGQTPGDAPLVRAAERITTAMRRRPERVGCSSDANVPMSLGIPAITIGVGGESGGIHTLDEWYVNDGGTEGVERALLIVLAAAGVEEEGAIGNRQ
jgi:tripeptide aminopeptidase